MTAMSDSDPIVLFERLYQDQVALLTEKRDAALVEWLRRIERRIREKLRELGHHHHHRRYVLLQPTLTDLTSGDPLMANYPLKTNVVAHFVITETNPTTGALDPVDPNDVFTVVSSDPVHLQAVIDQNAAGQTTVSVNWIALTDPMLTGVGISITDSLGNTADDAETFDMVPPAFVPDQIGIDIANVVETPQAIPPIG